MGAPQVRAVAAGIAMAPALLRARTRWSAASPWPMSGRDLGDAVLRINPSIKVLFTAGYTRNAIIHHGRLDEDVNFVGKPCSNRLCCRRGTPTHG